MYKHEENQIDPRDKNLVTYSPTTKRFVVEDSSLHGSGIQPQSHHFVIGGPKWTIWIWSEKFQTSVLYVHNRSIKSPSGELVADVYTPRFDMIVEENDSAARAASMGTELHILND